MTTLRFGAMPTDQVRTYRNGEPDGNGQVPQQRRSDGDHIACRHCLAEVAATAPYLVLAYLPFLRRNPTRLQKSVASGPSLARGADLYKEVQRAPERDNRPAQKLVNYLLCRMRAELPARQAVRPLRR